MSFISKALRVVGVIVLLISVLIGLLASGALGRVGLWRFLASRSKGAIGLAPATLSAEERARAFNFTDLPDLHSHVSLVTGANSGVGYWTAFHLAKKGSIVVLACRSKSKCHDAVVAIKAEIPTATLHTILLDTSSLKSVDSFTNAFKAKFNRLDHLVLNAGIGGASGLTEDGIEVVFATNHLGHFKLYKDLSSIVERTAKTHGAAAVVAVSSAAHYSGKNVPSSIDDVNNGTRATPFINYGDSKLHNVLFANEIAARAKRQNIDNLFVNSIHPGLVNTNIFAPRIARWKESLHPFVFSLINNLFNNIQNQFMWSAEDGALTQLYAAASRDIVEKKITGKYFHPIAQELEFSPLVNTENQEKLWKVSEEILKIKGF